MEGFGAFFVILLAAVLFSQLFSRMHMPWVVALIIGGFVIGPHGFELFEPDPTINFLAQVGLVFLMFMAGLESHIFSAGDVKGRIAIVTAFSAIIPCLVGMGIAIMFGYELPAILLLGLIFIASSVAILIPSLQANHIIDSQLGKVIIGSAIIVDTLSLLLLSLFLQIMKGGSFYSIILTYPLVFAILGGLLWIVPKIKRFIFPEYPEEQDLFEREFRMVLLILIGLVVLFELFGFHGIIAGFFAGLILSKVLTTRIIKAKLHAIGYGFFIPVFFVVLGSSMDLGVFSKATGALALVLVVIIGSLGSKLISGYLGGKIAGFTGKESLFLGVAHTPSISTALAVAYLGFNQGFIDQRLLTAIILLSIVASMSALIFVDAFAGKVESQKVMIKEGVANV